ncbi:Putative ribonuclease H protein At1g65750 [Linum perenne]
MTPPQAGRGEDDWVWVRERSEIFSIKSAYNLICQVNSLPSSKICNVVWKWKGTKIQRQIAWLAGPSDGVTLNSDGSVLGVGGKAAAGGLIRDGYGQCIQAYAMNLGTCTITRVELRGALEGIERAWLAGFDDVRFTAFISPHLNDIPLV